MTNQEKLISQLEDAIEWFENYSSNLDSGRTRSLFVARIASLKSIKEKLPEVFDESCHSI